MEIRICIYIMNQIDFLKCLADQTRLDLVMLIVLNGELCVCDLSDILGLSQPKISRHLAQLRLCKILKDRRQGQWMYYDLHPDLADWSLAILHSLKNTNPIFNDVKFKRDTSFNCCE